jgi:hypothetical protein
MCGARLQPYCDSCNRNNTDTAVQARSEPCTDLSGLTGPGKISGKLAVLARTPRPVCVLVVPARKFRGCAVVVHGVSARAHLDLHQAPIEVRDENGFHATEDAQLGLQRQKGIEHVPGAACAFPRGLVLTHPVNHAQHDLGNQCTGTPRLVIGGVIVLRHFELLQGAYSLLVGVFAILNFNVVLGREWLQWDL